MPVNTIEELESPNGGSGDVRARDLFEARHRSRNVPVVIRQGASHWPAIRKWDLDYMARKCGSCTASAMLYGGNRPEQLRVRVDEAVERIKAGEQIYFSQSPIMSEVPEIGVELPELMEDLEVPPLIADKTKMFMTAFVGANTYASMHFHPDSESMKVQLVGKKRALLFPPDADLQSLPFLAMNFSRISFADWNEDRERVLDAHPALRDMNAYECVLEPGDMLFIPNYWWHSFFGDGVSMSITYFWSDAQPEFDTPPLNYRKTMRMMRVVRPMKWITGLPGRLKDMVSGA